jgi:flagellar protein FliS
MTETNLYKEYTEDNVLNCSALGLVVALYQGAIESIAMARTCLSNRDIPGRTKTINKAYNILSQLIMSLDNEKGGDISKNLGALYAYMQTRLLEAQMKQKAAPLEEVENLLSTMLEGWKEGSRNFDPLASFNTAAATAFQYVARSENDNGSAGDSVPYGGYLADYGDLGARQAYSF